MCEDQLDTQNHLFTSAKYGKELSIETFFDLFMTEEDCNNLEKRLETHEKAYQDLSHPSVPPPINASVSLGTIIIIYYYNKSPSTCDEC